MKVIVVSSLTTEGIIEMDFLEAKNCKVHLKQKALCFQDKNLRMALKNSLTNTCMTTEAFVVVTLE